MKTPYRNGTTHMGLANTKPITTEVIPEVQRKVQLFPLPKHYTLETALISPCGADKALRAADYFHHYIVLNDLFS